MAFICYKGQMKITYFKMTFSQEPFYFYALTLNFQSFKRFKGLKLNIGLFWPLLVANAKFKQPTQCSPMGRFCPINLIWLCPCVHNIRMILENVYSSQTKLIGQSLHVSEHGIGYLNLAFEPQKCQKRAIFSFKPLKRLEGLEIQSQSISMKRFLTKSHFEICKVYLAFIADEGHKQQYLVLVT